MSVPQVAPEQPVPESVQLTPLFCVSFCNCAVKFDVWETCTEPEVGFTATEMGGGAVVTVMVADADFVLSATEVAFKVTEGGAGAAAGALYVTEVVVTLVSVPQVAPEQPVPESVQLTPLFCVSFCNCAVKFAVCETCTEADGGFTATVMAGGAVIVIATEADLELSAMDVAVSVTVAGLGTVVGAV